MTGTKAADPTARSAERCCPQCGAEIPPAQGYVSWCDQCGWNLKPYEPEQKPGALEAMYGSIGRRQSQRLFERLRQAGSLAPSWTLSRVLALAVAMSVHAVTLAVTVLGVVLLIAGWPKAMAIFGGLLCLAIAWFLRPRPVEIKGEVAAREQHPTLYRLADDVAHALNARPVHGIVLDGSFNAAYTEIGWRRRPVIVLGVPLLAILDGQERVSLLAHEIAHGVNGDPARGLIVGTALESLITWHEFLVPGGRFPEVRGLAALARAVAALLLLGIAALPWLGIYVLLHLLWHDRQRAEYLADLLGARIAGCEAALRELDKSHLSRTYTYVVQQVTLSRGKLDLFDELRRQAAAVPARELERIRRAQQMEESRLDRFHPPTAYRLALLRAQQPLPPAVTLSAADSAQIDRELIPAQKRVAGQVMDSYRASLYY